MLLKLYTLAQLFTISAKQQVYMMTFMNWTPTHFPAAMRSLSPSTRAKAIELANVMMARGDMDRQAIIQTSIIEARRQARDAYPGAQQSVTYSFPQA